MNLLTNFVFFALVGHLAAAPAEQTETVIFTTDNVKEVVKYIGKHDIVNLLASLKWPNVTNTNTSSDTVELELEVTLFFVEADIQPDKGLVYQGLYVLKDGNVKMLLENGRDAALSDDSEAVFFGASDGLYIYNPTTNSAEKYGPITDSIVGIAKELSTNVIYILTEDHVLYKVTNNGETKQRVEDVVGAKQIVLDYSNNLYFYSDIRHVYVRTGDGVKKIEGLPENATSLELVKPPLFLQNSVPIVVDNNIYVIYANGTIELTEYKLDPQMKPTAYAMERLFIQYVAYNKTIYEFNLQAQIQIGGNEGNKLSQKSKEN